MGGVRWLRIMETTNNISYIKQIFKKIEYELKKTIYMGNLDLSILEKIPEHNLKVILEIEPLAPLSMVSELPGSYYKTLKCPDKKMLCGLFENILGWHIDSSDRKAIIKELVRLRKKQTKKNPQSEYRR